MLMMVGCVFVLVMVGTLPVVNGQPFGTSPIPTTGELFQIGDRDYGQVLPFLHQGIADLPAGAMIKHQLESVIHHVLECPQAPIQQPAWAVDLRKSREQLNGWIQTHHLDINEGGIFLIPQQECFYSLLARRLAHQPAQQRVQVCETGFNAGHSATMWLAAGPNVHYLGFDLGIHGYARVIAGELELEYGRRRFRLIFGSSVDTLPKFIAENPGFTCDILNVDGGHSTVCALHDIINFYRMLPTAAGRPHYAVIDDTNCIEGVCGPVMRAMQLSEEYGLLRPFYRQCSRDPRFQVWPFASTKTMQELQCNYGFTAFVYNHGAVAEDAIVKLQEFIRNNPSA